MNQVTVVPLEWADEPLGTVEFPAKQLILRHGIGSGLSADRTHPGIVWAIADRGPNLELRTAIDDYGWTAPDDADGNEDAKLMVQLDVGPYLARLRLGEDSIELLGTLPLRCSADERVVGLPIPEGDHHECEPAFAMDGQRLGPRNTGMDTEGVVAMRNGRFWIGEEYGPSLLEVGSDGTIMRRIMPQGRELRDAPFIVEPSLPALAARRHLNRGFEAIAAAPSQARLFLAFQSPLAHPDRKAFKKGRHVRLWELDANARVIAQYLYPLDQPSSFRRDSERRELKWKDLKLCELTAIGERTLLVLERSKETSKIYRVELDETLRTPAEHLEVETRPTVEELSRADGDFPLPVLAKTLLFTSDDYPEVTSDMEGLTALSDRSLLIVSDNDFGVEDKETRFFRLDFAEPFTV